MTSLENANYEEMIKCKKLEHSLFFLSLFLDQIKAVIIYFKCRLQKKKKKEQMFLILGKYNISTSENIQYAKVMYHF